MSSVVVAQLLAVFPSLAMKMLLSTKPPRFTFFRSLVFNTCLLVAVVVV